MVDWIDSYFFQISAQIAAIVNEDFVIFFSPIGMFQENASR
jgi:hypothetical protein